MSMQQAGTGIADRTGAIIEDLKGLEGPLIPILHGIQAADEDVGATTRHSRAPDPRVTQVPPTPPVPTTAGARSLQIAR